MESIIVEWCCLLLNTYSVWPVPRALKPYCCKTVSLCLTFPLCIYVQVNSRSQLVSIRSNSQNLYVIPDVQISPHYFTLVIVVIWN